MNYRGNMSDLDQNDNTWTVILYQSFSGDSAVGEGQFEMIGGTLNSSNGGLFYTTNTESEFILSGVSMLSCEGAITDAEGNSVSIVGADGTSYVQGDSQYVVTVSQ